MSQSLLFPLVFWDGPPKHDVTAITAGEGYVVTGAVSGELCLWKMDKTTPRHHEDWIGQRYLRPVVAMVSEGSVRVTSLASLKRGWDDLEMIISGDMHGCITLWDSSGGRCHFSKKMLKRSISGIFILPTRATKDNDLIACFSRGGTELQIIDVHTLERICCLSPGSQIIDATVTSVGDRDIVLAVVLPGRLVAWDISKLFPYRSKREEVTPWFQLGLETILNIPTNNKKQRGAASEGKLLPLEIKVSKSAQVLCVRVQKGYFSLINLPELLVLGASNPKLPAKVLEKILIVKNAALESKEERTIRETEGEAEIAWQGFEFINDSGKKNLGGLALVFYSRDGTTRFATFQNEKAIIDEGPQLLRSQRVALKRAHTQIPALTRQATEELEFHNQQEGTTHSKMPGWDNCKCIRVRAVGVGLSEHLDENSTSDPYLQVFSGDELLWETEVVHNSPNPHWKDIVLQKNQIDPKRPLRFHVFEKDDLMDELIGSLDVELTTLLNMAQNCTIALYSPDEKVAEGKNSIPVGSIRFKAIHLENETKGSAKEHKRKSIDPSAFDSTGGDAKLRSTAEFVDNFERAAGKLPGRPRALEVIRGVRLHVSPDGTIVSAGGSGLVQLWLPCPPPPPGFEEENNNADLQDVKNYVRSVEEKIKLWTKPKEGQQESIIRQFRINGGLMSPVFWIGDAFDALQSNPCTASVLAAGGDHASVTLLLARGYQKGGIVAASLLKGRKHVTFEGHKAEVTCIVAVPAGQSPTKSPLLVSGGLDGCLCMWDLAGEKQLGCFQCRSPVLSLYWPQATDSWASVVPGDLGVHEFDTISGDLVMAVTADHGVHIVSLSKRRVVQVLQGHDSRVAAIYRNQWAVEGDYIVTQTLSGCCYIWSLSTGHLDRLLGRNEAYGFLLARGLLDPTKERTFLQASKSDVKLTSSQNTSISATLPNTPTSSIMTAPPAESPGLFSSKSTSSMEKLIKDRQLQSEVPAMALEAPARTSRIPKSQSSRISLKTSFSRKDSKRESRSSQLPISRAKRRSMPLMQVCSMGRAGGVLRANMFCINVDQLIAELRTQYRHLSTRPASGRGATPTLRALLSYLFEWRVDKKIDKILEEQFGFRRPYPTPAFGVMSYRSKAVALLLPEASKGNSRWELCPTLTGIHSLSLSALCMTMLSASHPSKQVFYTQVVSHYGVHLPDHLKTYVEPSLEVLVIYSYNDTEEIHMASRLLLQGRIERSNVETLRKIVGRWTSSEFFHEKQVASTLRVGVGSPSPFFQTPILSSSPAMDRRLVAALVLCLIAADQQRKRQKSAKKGDSKSDTKRKEEAKGEEIKLPASVVGKITDTLLRVVFDIGSREETNPGRSLTAREVVVSSLAAELMGKGFFLWRRHVTDVAALISKLHRLSLIKRAALAGAAHRALLQAGQSSPRTFIRQMGAEALNLRNKPRCRSGALFAIVALVKKYPSSLISALPSAVQIIIKCLDPSAPALRKSLLRPATAALHALVQNYPSVTFHQKSQRFAVGTTARTQSVIVIYDLRTATKWRILSGHTGTITAVSFNPSATYLASYAPDEIPPVLKFWETSSQGFFTNFLGMSGNCVKTVKLPKIKKNVSARSSEALLWNRIVWISPKMVKLRREDGTVTNHNI